MITIAATHHETRQVLVNITHTLPEKPSCAMRSRQFYGINEISFGERPDDDLLVSAFAVGDSGH